MPVRKYFWLAVAVFASFGLTVGLFWQMRATDVIVSLSQEELQKKVEAEFPVDKQVMVVAHVQLSHPVVRLAEGSDRIGIGVDLAASVGMSKEEKGHIDGDWKVRYEPSDGALYFDDPRLQNLTVQGLSPTAASAMRKVAEPIVKEYLSQAPVYRLKAGDFKQDLARQVLKSVSVQNGKLRLVLGAK